MSSKTLKLSLSVNLTSATQSKITEISADGKEVKILLGGSIETTGKVDNVSLEGISQLLNTNGILSPDGTFTVKKSSPVQKMKSGCNQKAVAVNFR